MPRDQSGQSPGKKAACCSVEAAWQLMSRLLGQFGRFRGTMTLAAT